MVEFANRLVARGHDVTFYLPPDVELRCSWMPCDAAVKPITDGFGDDLDVVLFNHEPQWHLLERFEHARRRVFYALHYARLYGKEGSWESVRAPVDLQLANSNWTADQIFAETGYRPLVQLGGVNRDTFHPYPGPKRYPLLCSGEQQRAWKGTDTILEAGHLLGLAGRAVRGQEPRSARARARVRGGARVRGRQLVRGLLSAGLEALACGTPLVTTDNGGCREYAIDGETALVVPPRDARAMADAIRRLLDDEALAARFVANGLDLVGRDFDWERRTDEFESVLDGLCAGPAAAPPPTAPRHPPSRSCRWSCSRGTTCSTPSSSSSRCAATPMFRTSSSSSTTDRPGKRPTTRVAADQAVLNETNRGFARGMNQGLSVARGATSRSATTTRCSRRIGPGICCSPRGAIRTRRSSCPAVSAAQSGERAHRAGRRHRSAPAVLAPPAAIVYVMPADVVRARRVGRGVRDRERRRRRPVLQGMGERPRHRLRPARARAARREGYGVASRRLAGTLGEEPPAVSREVDG